MMMDSKPLDLLNLRSSKEHIFRGIKGIPIADGKLLADRTNILAYRGCLIGRD